MTYTKPFVWKRNSVPNAHIFDFSNEKRKTDSYIFMHGRPLPFDSGDNPQLECTKQDPSDYDLVYTSLISPEQFLKYDCAPTNAPAPLVNKRVLDILMEICPDDIQAFPAIIRNEKKKQEPFENHDYWVINITKSVSAYDPELSIYEVCQDTGFLTKVKKIVLKTADCLDGVHIGRQYNRHTHIILSPILVKRFKKEKITGVKFLKDTEVYTYKPLSVSLVERYEHNQINEAKRVLVSSFCMKSSFHELLMNIEKTSDADLSQLSHVLHELIKDVLSNSDIHQVECDETLKCLDKRMKN